MTDKNKNLLVRVISGLTLLPGVLYLLYLGGWWTAALLGFAAGACAWEYISITLKGPFTPVAVLTVGMASATNGVLDWSQPARNTSAHAAASPDGRIDIDLLWKK